MWGSGCLSVDWEVCGGLLGCRISPDELPPPSLPDEHEVHQGVWPGLAVVLEPDILRDV